MAKKVEIGDVIEIPTKVGKAYAQYSHHHKNPPTFGALLRVLPGIYSERPKNLEALISKRELFSAFFPLQTVIDRGIFRVVARIPVPADSQKFPLFRAGTINPATGKVEQWWLWDGTKEWKVGKLSDDQLDFPIRGIWNDMALIERIEQGWTPRTSEALMQAARLRNRVRKAKAVIGVTHFLLFDKKDRAEQAKRLVEDAGFEAEFGDSGSGFALKVRQGPPLKEEYIEHVTVQLIEIARIVGGVYDAWETALK